MPSVPTTTSRAGKLASAAIPMRQSQPSGWTAGSTVAPAGPGCSGASIRRHAGALRLLRVHAFLIGRLLRRFGFGPRIEIVQVVPQLIVMGVVGQAVVLDDGDALLLRAFCPAKPWRRGRARDIGRLLLRLRAREVQQRPDQHHRRQDQRARPAQ